MRNSLNLFNDSYRKIFSLIKYYWVNILLTPLAFVPRYLSFPFLFLGKKITIIDGPSYAYLYRELFLKEIYKFSSSKRNPYIVDCGAYIGLSVIYFKILFPQSKIIAFEPDPIIFHALSSNLQKFNFKNIQIYNAAVWNKDGEALFFHEEADAGRIINQSIPNKTVSVSTLRLRRFINKHVDLLKIDIEGSEYEVLNDCKEYLHNVDKLFIEYHSNNSTQQQLGDIFQILRSAGFRYYIDRVGIMSPHPFIHISSYNGFDNQLNIFAYRNKTSVHDK